jgi:DNA-binding transcriptional regulator GbsR (MarR family)
MIFISLVHPIVLFHQLSNKKGNFLVHLILNLRNKLYFCGHKLKKMTSEERIKRQKELVETAGRFYEKKGMQPIAGRILGLLTVMDKEQFTFDEIVEELVISKGSASNALRMLEVANTIEYITIPGIRKRFFQLKKLDKFTLIDEHRANLISTRDYLQMVLDLKANRNSGNAVLIANLIDMLNFFMDKFEELKNEYTTKK